MATEQDIQAALDAVRAAATEHPDQFPMWEDASDLSRLHAQAFVLGQSGGIDHLKSRGAFRFAGDGVHGHTVDLAQAGEILALWQGLVTSLGAAAEGATSGYGQLPGEIVRRTRLDLVASPSAGSVVLEFEAHVIEVEERYPKGQLRTDGQAQTPLVERSVDAALDVLGLATRGADVDLQAELLEFGPRVASRARELAELAANARLDIDATWEVPGRGRRRTRASAGQLKLFAENLKRASLDSEAIPLVGILRTISDHRKIDIEITEPSAKPGGKPRKRVLSVDRGDVDFTPYNIGNEVRLIANMTVRRRPGGGESRSYEADSVAPL